MAKGVMKMAVEGGPWTTIREACSYEEFLSLSKKIKDSLADAGLSSGFKWTSEEYA